MLDTVKSFAKTVVPVAIWKRLRQWKIKTQKVLYRERVVEHTYGNVRLKIALTDPLSVGWYDHDWERPAEIDFLVEKVGLKGKKIFDLGAHHGIVALMLANECGQNGAVIAVEASTHNFKSAQKNLALNPQLSLTLVHGAIAQESGMVHFTEDYNGHVQKQDDIAAEKVRAFGLDELMRMYGRPDVIFMDIEGHEYPALLGASETLKARPHFFVEVHSQHGLEETGGNPEKILQFFTEGYDIYLSIPEVSGFSLYQELAPLPRCRFYLIALSRPGVG